MNEETTTSNEQTHNGQFKPSINGSMPPRKNLRPSLNNIDTVPQRYIPSAAPIFNDDLPDEYKPLIDELVKKRSDIIINEFVNKLLNDLVLATRPKILVAALCRLFFFDLTHMGIKTDSQLAKYAGTTQPYFSKYLKEVRRIYKISRRYH
jgi:hypothetical protein